jgi:hypothetical protein
MDVTTFTGSLDERLDSVLNGVRPDWVSMAIFLNELDRLDVLYIGKHFFDTFNEFVKWFCEKTLLKRASLLRYRAIARDYSWLKDKMEEQQLECPSFADLDPAIGPEGLEILIKLVKFAPHDIWKDSAQGVFNQTLRRAELRRRWVATRQIGSSARGRGSSVVNLVDIDVKSQPVKDHHSIVRMYAALEAMDSKFLGLATLSRHNIWPFDERVEVAKDEHPLIFQAAMTVQRKSWRCSELHGVFILPGLAATQLRPKAHFSLPDRQLRGEEWPFWKVLVDAQRFVDRIWLVIPESITEVPLIEQLQRNGIVVNVLYFSEADGGCIKEPKNYPSSWQTYVGKASNDFLLRYLLSSTVK